jgi:hypothetical protein
MVVEAAVQERGPAAVAATAAAAAPGGVPPDGQWDLLGRLEKGSFGTRRPDSSVAVRRGEPAGCFLYGPYLHLPEGWYRLGFRCRCGKPRRTAQPVLGVEVIVLARFQQAWRDFTGGELASGAASLVFAVTAEQAIDGGNEGRFEFRFLHLGNADLAIDAVTLERLAASPSVPPEARRWRMLGRLEKSWFARRAGGSVSGRVRVARSAPAGCLLYGGWPYLRLPRGAFRLVAQASCGPPRTAGAPVLGIDILRQSRMSNRGWRTRLLRLPDRNAAAPLASREVTAAEIAAGPVTLDFAVPSELAIEAGADAPFEIRLRHLGNASLAIDAVDLVRLDDDRALLSAVGPAQPVSAGCRKIVIIGNCQMETLRHGFSRIEGLSRRFDIKYHFVQLPPNLYEFALRDLESCDIVVAQDTRLWAEFPLRDAVRPGADIIKFPLVRFASLWPFDGWNGPGDKEAHAQEGPNLTFPYLDGLLGRLRKEIPDPAARFAAYRSLEIPRLVNYRRLHQLEVQRLEAMDRQFGIAIGAYILENFRRRRILHTTVRPNWQVFGLLLQHLADVVGAKETISLPKSADALLRSPQVPVHPRIARDLGVKWADEQTRYVNHGREITWESYIRRYIAHYG